LFRFKDFVAYFGFVHGGVAISGVVWADWGFGKMKEEECSQWTPSSAACVAHTPPLLSGSDGRGMFLTILDVSTLPFSFLNILLHILDLFMVLLQFSMWFGQIRGLERQRRRRLS